VLLLVFCVAEVSAQDSTRVLPLVPIYAQNDSSLRLSVANACIPHFEITKRKMDQLGAVDIGEALKFIPGVQIRDYGGIGGIKTLGYRSLGANHTTVIIDGQRLSNAQTGTINLSSFELFGLEKITFTSGQITDLTSSATTFVQANTVALRSVLASPPQQLRVGVYSNTTSIHAYEKGAYAQTILGKYFYGGVQALMRFGSGAYPYKNAESPEEGEIIRTNTRLFNYRLRSVVGFERNDLKFLVSGYYQKSEQELPGAAVLYNPSNDQKLWTEDWRLNGSQSYVKGKFSLQSHLDFQSNYTRYFDPYYLNLEGFIDARYHLRTMEGGLLLSRSFRFPNERIFFGGDVAIMNLDASQFNTNPTRLQQNFVFGGATLMGKFKVETNLTATYTEDDDTFNGSVTYFKLSPFLSVGYAPFKNAKLRLRAFYKNAYRLPSFNDLYYNFIGNLQLKPEDAQLINLGLTQTGNLGKATFEYTIDAFRNEITNKIIAIPTKDLFNWSMQNIGTALVYGLDLGLIWSIKLKSIDCQLNVNQSFNRSLDRTDPNSDNYNQQLPYTPFYSATYGLMMTYKKLSFSSNVLYSGYRFSLNENNYANLLPAYTDLSVGVSRVLKWKNQEILLDVKAMNIFNKNYEVIRSFPMPGRYYQLRLKYTLDK
jgi:vitamin B12 transporter